MPGVDAQQGRETVLQGHVARLMIARGTRVLENRNCKWLRKRWGKLNFGPHGNGRKATPPKAVKVSAPSPRPAGVLPSFLELSKQLSHLSSPPLFKPVQLFILLQNNHLDNPSFLRVTIGMCVISFALLSHARANCSLMIVQLAPVIGRLVLPFL
jgi:hypothetical protein